MVPRSCLGFLLDRLNRSRSSGTSIPAGTHQTRSTWTISREISPSTPSESKAGDVAVVGGQKSPGWQCNARSIFFTKKHVSQDRTRVYSSSQRLVQNVGRAGCYDPRRMLPVLGILYCRLPRPSVTDERHSLRVLTITEDHSKQNRSKFAINTLMELSILKNKNRLELSAFHGRCCCI